MGGASLGQRMRKNKVPLPSGVIERAYPRLRAVRTPPNRATRDVVNAGHIGRDHPKPRLARSALLGHALEPK